MVHNVARRYETLTRPLTYLQLHHMHVEFRNSTTVHTVIETEDANVSERGRVAIDGCNACTNISMSIARPFKLCV